MIVDSSAILCILLNEPDAERFAQSIAAEPCRISAATFVETSSAIEHQGGPAATVRWDAFARRASLIIEPVTAEQAHGARQAWFDFGKGRHPAALNFGDCFSYALAKATGEPLLFKGDDFRRTDIAAALP